MVAVMSKLHKTFFITLCLMLLYMSTCQHPGQSYVLPGQVSLLFIIFLKQTYVGLQYGATTTTI